MSSGGLAQARVSFPQDDPVELNSHVGESPGRQPSVQTAFVFGMSAAGQLLYGRPLLERILASCEKNGVSRFVVECAREERAATRAAAGRFRDHPGLILTETDDGWLRAIPLLSPSSPCIVVRGNLVFSSAQLRHVLAEYAKQPGESVSLVSAGGDSSASLSVGPLPVLLEAGARTAKQISGGKSCLPFGLGSGAGDKLEAELRIARAMREETVNTDGLLARIIDRRLSWRISRRLARTRITPNQVTLTNTALGFLIALMFAMPSYWLRLGAGLLFLVSVTLDGVDGELARLKMVESESGRRLDVLTDNLVEVAIFVGLMVGCYRASGSSAYFYLMAILLAGFGLCAITVNRALSLDGAKFSKWIDRVEQIAARDFAYLVFVLALLDQLDLFAWGTAFGTWVFAAVLWKLTSSRARRAGLSL